MEYASGPLQRQGDSEFYHATYDDTSNAQGQRVSLFIEGNDVAGNYLGTGPGFEQDLTDYISLVPSPTTFTGATLQYHGVGTLVPSHSTWLNITLKDHNELGDLQEIVVDLIIATYVHEAGGLSDPTITCMGKSFEDLDIAAVFDGDVETAIISALLGTLLCLTDDEASRISAGALIGEQLEGRPTLQDMRCVLQLVDLSDLMALLSGFQTADDPDFETLLPLLGAFGECGIELPDSYFPLRVRRHRF